MIRIRKLVSAILILSLVLGLNMGLTLTANADSCGGFAEKDVYTPGEEEVIRDPVLHWAVRSALNQIEDRPVLTAAVVGKITGVSFEACAHPEEFADWTQPFWIEDLEGLQYAKRLSMVDICYISGAGRRIKSLEPLAELSELRTLWLKQDGINDISPLSNLSKMDHLEISGNEISDISPVAGMRKLTHLIVEHNSLNNVDAVEYLSGLEYLNIANNNISGLPDMSNLTNLAYLDASGNNLTNADVARIGKCRNLTELNLNNNAAITDVRPLAGLINLDETALTLPVSKGVKDDLTAAINVNKLIDQFNISKMSEADIEYVEEALAAYSELSDEQKSYFDPNRISAIENNLALVRNGSAPVYYEEYDEGGGTRPVWDRITVKAVDNNGNPVAGVNFVKKSVGVSSPYTTNARGIVTIPHSSWDMAWDLSVYLDPAETRYVARPDKYEYEVNGDGRTYIVNGEWATGLEELVFVLTPEDEYVDRSALEDAIGDSDRVEESFRYTEESYEVYETALKNAKDVYDAGAASQSEIDAAAEALNAAIDGLARNDKLTAVKIKVIDENGNAFARPFQVQVKSSDESVIRSYNDFTDVETGAVIFPAKDNWPENFTLNFRTCWREPYTFTCESVPCTIGVNDGKRYFKTVNGKAVGSDYEITVTAVADLSNTGAVRTALSDYLHKVIESADSYDENRYTVKSFAALEAAVNAGREIAEEIDSYRDTIGDTYDASAEIGMQTECNAAAAAVRKAEAELALKANTVALTKLAALNYTETMYTRASWAEYAAALEDARSILADDDASQAEVDDAAAVLKAAQSSLVMLANKTELKTQLDKAEAIDTEDYISGIQELEAAIAEGRSVYNDPDAVQAEVDKAAESIRTAIEGLKKPQPPVDYECLEGLFRAMVIDESGKPVSGVTFIETVNGTTVEGAVYKSDSDGVVRVNINGDNRNKTTVIKVSDPDYSCDDEHSYIITGINQWICSISTIDGMPYEPGKFYLTYTVKPSQGGTGDPDKPGGEDPDNPDPDDPDKPGVDKSLLKEQIDITISLSTRRSDYTAASWTRMQEALTYAKSVYSDSKATQKTADLAAAALKEAREKLVRTGKPAVQKTRIRSLKGGKKRFTVRAVKCKASKATGYQARYSLKKSMKKARTVRIGTSTKTTTKTIRKLKSGRRYYVQVRTYRKYNGRTYYSKWSAKKSVKVK